MFEDIIPIWETIVPIISPIIIFVVCLYIIKKSGFWKSTKKLMKTSNNSTDFLKQYSILSFSLIKMVQVFLVKYAIYIAVYGFILSNAYILVGFEGAVLFGIALTVARVQLKSSQSSSSSGVPFEEYDALKKKYILTRKLLDENLNKKEVKH